MKTKLITLALLVALADNPSFSYNAPASRPSAPVRLVEIVRDDRIHPAADSSYTFDVETEDGIVRHEAGGPGAQQGSVSCIFFIGQVSDLQFVANANGYKPQSPFQPVAPALPHSIPAHALEQIERGLLEYKACARGELRDPSSQGHSIPS
ncbi:cuticle protein AM1199-like [Penaeus monodon]|uniref:cuticle protein AM1199-like n=1 Tax=Penaeus monodon TaxID=6687 RepID=UPI0018A76A34|nr:cuticle protein AM1199-like [Penaeus monodon]